MYTATQRYHPTVLVERPAHTKVVPCRLGSTTAAALLVPRGFSMPRLSSILSDIQYTSSKGSACDPAATKDHKIQQKRHILMEL